MNQSPSPQAELVGMALIGPELRIAQPLDELIFEATSKALADAGLDISQVDAVYTATSDLLDGRAISTMTLTASTGSFGKHEMRLCDDGIAALALAVDGTRSGIADVALVTSWSKLSEANLAMIDPLSAEPAFTRPLSMTPDVVAAIMRSSWEGRTTQVEKPRLGGDAAVCFVVARPGISSTPLASVLGAGWSAGTYLEPDGQMLPAVNEACMRALLDASVSPDEIDRVHVGGFFDISDDEIQGLSGTSAPVRRSKAPDLELGYAAGLVALSNALADPGVSLIVSRSGIGSARGYATVLRSAV